MGNPNVLIVGSLDGVRNPATNLYPVNVDSEGRVRTVSGDAVQALSPIASGMKTLTVDATVGGVQFTAFDAATTAVYIDVQTAQCRMTLDGTAPTTSVGHLLDIGDNMVLSLAQATAAKFIRTGGTSGVLVASPMTN